MGRRGDSSDTGTNDGDFGSPEGGVGIGRVGRQDLVGEELPNLVGKQEGMKKRIFDP